MDASGEPPARSSISNAAVACASAVGRCLRRQFRPRRRWLPVAGSGHGLCAVTTPDRGGHIGLAVAAGRPIVLAVESGVAEVFVVLAASPSPDRRGCWCSASPAMGSRTLAEAPPLCGQHTLVAAVLPGRGLGRRGHPRRADRRRRRVSSLAPHQETFACRILVWRRSNETTSKAPKRCLPPVMPTAMPTGVLDADLGL